MNKSLQSKFLFVTFALTISSMCFVPNLFSQHRVRNDEKAKVVAAFGFECQTTKFPRSRLKRVINIALSHLKNEGYPDGKRAVGYDLDGDGENEYFVALRDMGTGDNYVWGVFSVMPAKLLGIIRAEHIYVHRRTGKWPALTAHWHESVSESKISIFSFQNGRYRKNQGGYLSSVDKKNEPKYAERTTELYLCNRNINK